MAAPTPKMLRLSCALVVVASVGAAPPIPGSTTTTTTFADCVEINRCVGCTRSFFTKSFLGDDAAVLVSRRWRGGNNAP